MEKTYSYEEIESLLSARVEGAYSNGSLESDERAREIANRNFRLSIEHPAIIRQLIAENKELRAKAKERDEIEEE